MADLFEQDTTIPHYYGNIVRMLFIVGALIMLFGLPAISGFINIPAGISIIAILILTITAGLSSPRYLWSAIMDMLVAAAGFVVFEVATLQSFNTRAEHGEFFIANLALSGLFILATYFSVKTVRGFYITSQ